MANSSRTEGTEVSAEISSAGAVDGVVASYPESTGTSEPHPTAGLIDIAPSQAKSADVGTTVNYSLTVTNLGPSSRIADLGWNQPPAGWTAAVFSSDGITPLGDANSNSMPDVSLGPAGSLTDSEDIVMKVGVPLRPDVNQTVTNVMADAGSGDTDVAALNTTVYPFLYVDRWANPTTINRLGLGSNEITTITLDLEGRGLVIPGSIQNAADVVFLVDDTGSMGGAIDALKGDIQNVTDRLQENVSSLRMGLVSFKDVPEIDVDIDLTFDIDAFRAAVNALVATGGTDTPEDGDIALQTAANLSWRSGNVARGMVHITDAETHNNPHLPGVSRWAWQTKEIHTNTVGVGLIFFIPPTTVFCQVDQMAEYWLRRTAENGSGVYEDWYPQPRPPLPPVCPLGSLGDLILDGLMGFIPPIDTAARDPDETDPDPMVRDVLPPYIGIVPGTFRDPTTLGPRPPDYIGIDPSGNTVLEWNVSLVTVGSAWKVAFDVTSSLAGVVPTNVHGLSRASYTNWSNGHKEVLFPEVKIKVLGPSPVTTLIIGQPNYTSSETWVTSATPLSFSVLDMSKLGIMRTLYRVDGGAWVNYSATGPFTIGTEGRRLIEWYSEDFSGAIEPIKSRNLIVDDTAPITNHVIGTPSYVSIDIFITSSTPITLQPVDGGPIPVGPHETLFNIDGGPNQVYSTPFTISGEGLHTIRFWSDDLLGNTEALVSVRVIVDNTPPSTSVSIGTPIYLGAERFIRSTTPIALQSLDGGLIPVGTDATYFRIDGGGTATYSAPFTVTGDGRHSVEFWSLDLLSNMESTGSIEVVVDDSPPVTTVAVGSPSHLAVDQFITSATPLTLQGADGDVIPVGLNATFYRIDGGNVATYSAPFTITGEGAHLVEFWSDDLLGNTEAVGTLDVIVDDTAPTTSVSFGTPSYLSGNRYLTSTTPIALQGADGGAIPVGLAATFYKVDGGSLTAYSLPFTISGEGLHTVEFWSTDLLGNMEAANTFSVIVDDTPPTTSVSIGNPSYQAADRYVRSDTSISLQSTDGGLVPVGLSQILFRVDGGTPVPYSTPFTISGEGLHTVEFWSFDLLGNTELVKTSRVIVDDTPPTTSVSVGTPKHTDSTLYVTSATEFTVISTDGGAMPVGLAAMDCRIDGGTWAPCGSVFKLIGDDGPRIIEFRARDLLGNEESVNTLSVFLDNSAPVTTLAPGPGTYTGGTLFTLNASDSGSGVQVTRYKIDGGDWTVFGAGFSLPAGEHNITYRSIDNLGNMEPEKVAHVTIQGAPPPPPPAPEVTVNYKPMVALIFALMLGILGVWTARRRPWKQVQTKKAAAKAFIVFSLPFVLAEAGTGVVSFCTGLLSIPPLLGLGTVVDVSILVVGSVVVLLRFRKKDQTKQTLNPAEDTVQQPPSA